MVVLSRKYTWPSNKLSLFQKYLQRIVFGSQADSSIVGLHCCKVSFGHGQSRKNPSAGWQIPHNSGYLTLSTKLLHISRKRERLNRWVLMQRIWIARLWHCRQTQMAKLRGTLSSSTSLCIAQSVVHVKSWLYDAEKSLDLFLLACILSNFLTQLFRLNDQQRHRWIQVHCA